MFVSFRGSVLNEEGKLEFVLVLEEGIKNIVRREAFGTGDDVLAQVFVLVGEIRPPIVAQGECAGPNGPLAGDGFALVIFEQIARDVGGPLAAVATNLLADVGDASVRVKA